MATAEDGLPDSYCGTRGESDFVGCKGLWPEDSPPPCIWLGDGSPSCQSSGQYCSGGRCPATCGETCCDKPIDLVGNWVDHTVKCFTCLLNAAPQASHVHMHNRLDGTPEGVREHIARWDVETISQSTEYQGHDYDEDDGDALLIDDMTYMWPYPLFCMPVGNAPDGDGVDDEVSWQAYNAIHVGSSKRAYDWWYELDAFTKSQNPGPKYGGAISPSGAGDRELPDILAPGSHPYTWDGWDPNYQWVDLDGCIQPFPPNAGTSFSAPTLAGIAARVASSSTAFRHNPAALKMALMLTAEEVTGGVWNSTVDGRDGTGTVSGYEAIDYAVNCADVTNDTQTPVVSGLCRDYGWQYMWSQKGFKVQVPTSIPSGEHLRAVVVWTANPDLNAGQNYLTDLDIVMQVDGGDWYYSMSYDANVEVIDVLASDLTPGAVYDLTVKRFSSVRIPSGATAQWFFIAVGWTWVKDHAP